VGGERKGGKRKGRVGIGNAPLQLNPRYATGLAACQTGKSITMETRGVRCLSRVKRKINFKIRKWQQDY
jgi:hypothetical protein